MDPALGRALDALRDLRRAYASYCDGPTELSWRSCEHAHDAALARLKDAAPAIDERIETARAAKQDRAGEAWESFEDADADVLSKEQELLRRLGFSSAFLAYAARASGRVLKRARKSGGELDAPRSTDALIKELDATKARVLTAFRNSAYEPRRRKNAHRQDARDYAMRQLYRVCTVTSNAGHRHLFAYSFALSTGISGAPGIARKHLVIATADRAAEAA